MKKTITLVALAFANLGAGAAIAAAADPVQDLLLSTGLNEMRLAPAVLPVAAPPLALNRAQDKTKGLSDVTYTFDREKLDAAADPFHFLRSYVDYFYLLVKANRGALAAVSAADDVAGWCVGDAHPENFGVLIQNNGGSLFTMNDVDDSGPCPVALDLYRLMTSARLYDQNTKLGKLVEAYAAGLQGQAYEMPVPVADMLRKSQKKGMVPDPKKVSGNTLVRDTHMNELSKTELDRVKTALAGVGGLSSRVKLLDAVSTSKVGGGSGGLLRYEVLLDNGGALLHLEFKEEVTPSIYPVAAGQIPLTPERISTTLRMGQGAGVSAFYGVEPVAGKYMFIRPRFDGNVGMSLAKQNDKDNKDIIRYEAYVLGIIHGRSVQHAGKWAKQVQNIPGSDWENDVELMTRQFEWKFSQLK
ncbi:MAG: DUF2252 family protein [Elusimicrobia bacterium]|nr:DUF2252 family protein [Elusimicrobiota bacterium]